MNEPGPFLDEHLRLTRRFFLGAGALCMTTSAGLALEPALEKALEKLEPYFTPADDFRDVSRWQTAAALAARGEKA